jgi:hypothetical protein
VQYVEQVVYIVTSQLLFYLWQSWRLILASAAFTLLLFAVAGVSILIRLR